MSFKGPVEMAIITLIINAAMYIEILDNFSIQTDLMITKSLYGMLRHLFEEQRGLKFSSETAYKIKDMVSKQLWSKSN